MPPGAVGLSTVPLGITRKCYRPLPTFGDRAPRFPGPAKEGLRKRGPKMENGFKTGEFTEKPPTNGGKKGKKGGRRITGGNPVAQEPPGAFRGRTHPLGVTGGHPHHLWGSAPVSDTKGCPQQTTAAKKTPWLSRENRGHNEDHVMVPRKRLSSSTRNMGADATSYYPPGVCQHTQTRVWWTQHKCASAQYFARRQP